MENVSQEVLANLALNHQSALNEKPLKDGDYDISFTLNNVHYSFSQKDGYWKWSFNDK